MTVPVYTFMEAVTRLPDVRLFGRVAGVLGMRIEVAGLERRLSIGDRCTIGARGGRRVPSEVIGFRDGRALLLPFGPLEGIGL
ncbi:MAG TPA: flagellum-specific ATP synthase FliI, partial [Kiloniellales bacterium]|nr:flagellum-specific ATP synthase FliI [Kiloniellales bacterium]